LKEFRVCITVLMRMLGFLVPLSHTLLICCWE